MKNFELASNTKVSRASFERAVGAMGARYEDYVSPHVISHDVKATDLLATDTFDTVDIETIVRLLSEAGFPKGVQSEVREIYDRMRCTDCGGIGDIIKARLSALTEEYTEHINSRSKSADIDISVQPRSVHQLASDIIRTMELADMTITTASRSPRNGSSRYRNIETQTSDEVHEHIPIWLRFLCCFMNSKYSKSHVPV